MLMLGLVLELQLSKLLTLANELLVINPVDTVRPNYCDKNGLHQLLKG